MKRRNFIKLSLAACGSLVLPVTSNAAAFDYTKVAFDKSVYENNNAQVIMIFLYGGASQLAGNMTNIDEIKQKSQTDYDSYFRGITLTANDFWQEAGGTYLEDMIANEDMSLFRTCYSQEREKEDNKSHGLCTNQNQKGSFDESRAGIVSNLTKILSYARVIDENSVMPFVSMEGGDSYFYAQGTSAIPSYLKAVGLDRNFDNPYKRYVRYWFEYTADERKIAHYRDNNASGFDPAFNKTMNSMAQKNNTNSKIVNDFNKREPLSNFISAIASAKTPDLGADAYPKNSTFAKRLEASIKVLAHNPDTKTITMNTGGLGGWDDHDNAHLYVKRSELFYKSLKSAMAHLEALGKKNNISIMVFAEFGRNVNLNSVQGWDHGNLQNFLVLGGKDYFSHRGVVGETVLDVTGEVNRLYMKPKEGTEQYEHLSIAATLYKAFGITNPEVLTNGNGAVNL
jgi:hypothetical protein